MKKIIVIGDNAAAVKIIEEIRTFDKESEIVLFSPDGHLPFDYSLFGDYLAKNIKEEALYSKPEKFYKEQKISVVLDKKIAKIDFKKNRIVTETKEEFFFDLLILAAPPVYRLPETKGSNKTGVFDLKRLSAIKGIAEILPILETISIESNSIESLKLVCGFKKRNKEVIFVVKGAHLLEGIIDRQSAEVIAKYLEENGIRFFMNNAVSEILGDSDVKAIRLKSGKVLACAVILYEQTPGDFRSLSESGLEIKDKVLVDEFFKTNVKNVFAFGQGCQFKSAELSNDISDYSMQASLLALNIKGEEMPYAPSLWNVSFKLFDMTVNCLGETSEKEDSISFLSADPSSKVHKKIFTRQGRLVGAVLINVENEKEKILRLIEAKADVSTIENQVLNSSCDYQQILRISENKEQGQPVA